jgi:hypothetical protein
MSWCTTTTLTYHTGTALDSTTLQAILDGAEDEINHRLAPLGITGSSDLEQAELHLSIARLYTRYHIVGQLTSGEIAASITNHENMAWELVEKFIATQDRTREVRKWVQI